MTPEEAMDIARGTPPSFVNDDGRRAAVILADEVERLREALTTCKELAESTSNGHHRVALASVHRVTEKALEPTP